MHFGAGLAPQLDPIDELQAMSNAFAFRDDPAVPVF